MMVLGIPAREDDIRAPHLAAIDHREAEHAGVEILHHGKIMNEDANMAHAERHAAPDGLACFCRLGHRVPGSSSVGTRTALPALPRSIVRNASKARPSAKRLVTTSASGSSE